MKNLLVMGLVLSSTVAFGAKSIEHASCNVAEVNIPGLTTSHASVLDMIEKKGYVLSKDKKAVLLNESGYSFGDDPTYKNTDAEKSDLQIKVSAYQQQTQRQSQMGITHSSDESSFKYMMIEAIQNTTKFMENSIDSINYAYNDIRVRKGIQITGEKVNKVISYNTFGTINNETDQLDHVKKVIKYKLPNCTKTK